MTNPAPTSPLVIGLIGGVASGKSSVARELESLGAKRLDADEVGHEALAAPEVIADLIAAFGDEILDAQGAIDRKALAAQAFATPQMVKQLNGITHPWIRRQMSERLASAKADPALPAVILDVSLLLESGAYQGQWDELIFVDAPKDQRIQRAIDTRGWDAAELERREGHQWPPERKRQAATCVIPNTGSLEELRHRVREWWDQTIPLAQEPKESR